MLRTAGIFAVAWAALLAVLVSRHSESGCRMAFMRPGYIPHTENVASKHAQTYGLYLYRDGRWNEINEITVSGSGPCFHPLTLSKPDGVPVLFIPGNAGSYKQARSIAAEMARQYRMYNDESPTSDEITPLDLWTGGYHSDNHVHSLSTTQSIPTRSSQRSQQTWCGDRLSIALVRCSTSSRSTRTTSSLPNL